MKKIITVAGMVFGALALSATVAFAIVTFDSGTGLGFVGKGDIQTPWGWNNAKMQSEAGNLSFVYDAITVYDVTCEWDTVTPHSIIHHSVTHTKHTGINDSVTYDARTHKQVDGFNLTGFGLTNETGGTIPSVGDSCPNGGNGVITAVDITSSSSGLYVSDASTGNGPTQLPF